VAHRKQERLFGGASPRRLRRHPVERGRHSLELWRSCDRHGQLGCACGYDGLACLRHAPQRSGHSTGHDQRGDHRKSDHDAQRDADDRRPPPRRDPPPCLAVRRRGIDALDPLGRRSPSDDRDGLSGRLEAAGGIAARCRYGTLIPDGGHPPVVLDVGELLERSRAELQAPVRYVVIRPNALRADRGRLVRAAGALHEQRDPATERRELRRPELLLHVGEPDQDEIVVVLFRVAPGFVHGALRGRRRLALLPCALQDHRPADRHGDGHDRDEHDGDEHASLQRAETLQSVMDPSPHGRTIL